MVIVERGASITRREQQPETVQRAELTAAIILAILSSVPYHRHRHIGDHYG
jgi:hypothetical protein